MGDHQEFIMMRRALATGTAGNRLEEALRRRKAGDAAGAEAAARAALSERPNEPTALFLLGQLRLEAGDLDAAETAVGGAVAVAPRHAPSWLALSSIRLRKGDLKGAGKALRRMLALEPGHAQAEIALSQCLLNTGDLHEAAEAARRAIAARPDEAQAHSALGAALSRLGQGRAAAAAYRDATDRDPGSASAQLGLAFALLQDNQPDEALPVADRALALEDHQALGWFALGLALRGVGDAERAVQAFQRAVELEPRLTVAQAQLGALHDDFNRPLLAERAWRAALDLEPDNVAAHVALSSLYCRAERFDLGRRHAEAALKRDAVCFGAHQNLAGICAREGRADQASRHRDLAYGARNVITIAAVRPLRHVLVLASTEAANSPDRYLLPPDRYSRHLWFVDYARDGQFAALPRYDVVFNAIADPDCAAAKGEELQRFARNPPRPLLNPPSAIARTARSLAAQLFSGVEGLIAPKTARFAAADLASRGAPGALKRAQLRWPLLIRPVGSHGGEGLELIRAAESLDLARCVGKGGGDVYATEFHDFRSEDGLYRKYRVFFVDRRPYPYHLAISDHWLVHYDKSGTSNHPQRLAEEQRFLADPETALGRRAYAAISQVGRRLDLDFAGVDFALTPEGDVLLFEANAAMLAHAEAPDGALAYKNVYVNQILEAFWSMLENAGSRLAA
jgi:tetratricopeptide (TPR) repeat protein/glutathione synthase/RimK-type ligase-like ATP-grasp enzyme